MPTKAAVRARPSGRTGHLGGEVDTMIIINGEDADEARSVVACAAALDAAAAAAAADAAAIAVLLDARLQGNGSYGPHRDVLQEEAQA